MLQRVMGMPFPASTQWELVRDAAKKAEAAFLELANQAGQGSVLMNDDTPMKILSFLADLKKRRERGEKPDKDKKKKEEQGRGGERRGE